MVVFVIWIEWPLTSCTESCGKSYWFRFQGRLNSWNSWHAIYAWLIQSVIAWTNRCSHRSDRIVAIHSCSMQHLTVRFSQVASHVQSSEHWSLLHDFGLTPNDVFYRRGEEHIHHYLSRVWITNIPEWWRGLFYVGWWQIIWLLETEAGVLISLAAVHNQPSLMHNISASQVEYHSSQFPGWGCSLHSQTGCTVLRSASKGTRAPVSSSLNFTASSWTTCAE